MFLAIPSMLALPTDAGAAARQDFARALVPKAAAFLMPPFPAAGDASSADVVTSQGVARIGADALQAAGQRGAGVRIAVLDQAFGATSRLDSLAGTELPPLARQHRMSFDTDTGIAGRDFNGNTSRHGEFVTEIVYDIAPDAEYWLVNYHTPDQFAQAVAYLRDVVHPNVVVHSNSFLFGRFDGTGFFAQQVDSLAAQGTIWVNSAGNYRLNHWEGPWADADGDGFLDVPGHGDDFPVDLIGTQRPACDLSADGTGTESSLDHYALGLFLDPAGTQPVLDARSGQPMISSFVPLPDPHDDLGPGFLSAPGTYHLKIMRVGNPPAEHLTLFCRFALPPDVDTTTSSIPTPGDARGSLTIGAFDATTLEPETYSSEGPTDDGRPKPDLAAPTNVAITGGSCGGTSCASAARRRSRRALARDDPGSRRAGDAPLVGARRGRPRLRLPLRGRAAPPRPQPSDPRVADRAGSREHRLGGAQRAPAAGRAGHARRGSGIARRCPAAVGRRCGQGGVRLDRHPPPGRRDARPARRRARSRRQRRVVHRLVHDRQHPTCAAHPRAAHRPREQPGARDHGRLRPRHRRRGSSGRGVRRSLDGEGLPHPASVRPTGPLHAARLDRGSRGQHAVAQQTVRVVGVLVEPSRGSKPAIWVRRARPGNVRVQLAGVLVRSLRVGRTPHRILLGALERGVYRVTVVAGAARASRLVRVP